MLSAVAHDLRTPLTALRVRVEMVEDDETRLGMSASLSEMQHMIEGTLTYARGVGRAEDSQDVDLSVFLEDLGEFDEQQLCVDAGEPLSLNIRPLAMKRAIRNLVENARRYGGGAQISWIREGRTAKISVSDRGPGIPDEELEQVFQPFYRIERSRSLETGGHGLGLSIAKAIILEHGGTISLQNREEGGLKATISLPLKAWAGPRVDTFHYK